MAAPVPRKATSRIVTSSPSMRSRWRRSTPTKTRAEPWSDSCSMPTSSTKRASRQRMDGNDAAVRERTGTMSFKLPALSLLEARVLGVLVEKQRTVPDIYPLSLNALVSGCNQKTSRDPILESSDAQVQATIDHLIGLSLVVESSGGRVMRYAHNVERVLGVPSQAVALLAALMLRGPQTVGELRINCERLHRFVDVSAVEAFLQELASRPAGS